MKLSQLRHLIAVVEAGTIRQAAKNVHLSQSSLTKSIQLLEETLGVELLHRASHGVTPTAAGEALIARARSIESELRQARNDIEDIRGAGMGEIRVSASPTVAMSLLPRAILDFKRERPKVSFHVEEGVYPDVLPAVRLGERDFAICLVPERPKDEDLHFEWLLRDHLVPAVRPAHPLLRRGRLTLADLAKLSYEWVIYRRGRGGRDVFEQTFVAAGQTPPQGTIECTSFACALALVEQSDCVTLVPAQIFAERRTRASIVPLAMDSAMPPWNVAVISREKHRLSPLCAGFLRQLHRSAARPRSEAG
ncbi:MAG: LysR family transcriptional regulator [Betaproteobacteria bacterium]|nr:LysR family transcriptional regulator [Betaproteobacteria bacterium]